MAVEVRRQEGDGLEHGSGIACARLELVQQQVHVHASHVERLAFRFVQNEVAIGHLGIHAEDRAPSFLRGQGMRDEQREEQGSYSHGVLG